MEKEERRNGTKVKEKTIIITGASGFLGKMILKKLSWHYKVIGLARSLDMSEIALLPQDKSRGLRVAISEHAQKHAPHFSAGSVFDKSLISIDLLDESRLREIFQTYKPEIVIHCAAMTDVNSCEKEKDNAFKSNVVATSHLVKFCKKYNSKLIFISTDAVFDGKKGNYLEEDKVCPINVYGKTKAEAEKLVRNLDDYMIIRTAVLYGRGGKKFINKMIDKLEKNENVEAANDIMRSPTLVDNVAEGIKVAIKKEIRGILHIAGDTKDSLYNITRKIAVALKKDISLVKPCPISKYEQGIAPQPRDTTLNIKKAKSIGINLLTIEEGILFLKEGSSNPNV